MSIMVTRASKATFSHQKLRQPVYWAMGPSADYAVSMPNIESSKCLGSTDGMEVYQDRAIRILGLTPIKGRAGSEGGNSQSYSPAMIGPILSGR